MFIRIQVSVTYLFNQDLLTPYPVAGGTPTLVKVVSKTGNVLAHILSGERHDREVSQ